MKSPFFSAVQARPRTLGQSRSNRFSTWAGSVKRPGLDETALGSMARLVLWRPCVLGSGVRQTAQALVLDLPPE